MASTRTTCPICGSTSGQAQSIYRSDPGCENDCYCSHCVKWYDPNTGETWGGNNYPPDPKTRKKKEDPETVYNVPEYIRQQLGVE